jgi:hypothetical protein
MRLSLGPGATPMGTALSPKVMPDFPGNDVVGARGVSADAKTADNFPIFVVQGQSAPENDDPSHGLPD